MELPASEYYYYNKDGLIVFTEKYHLKRGYCCKSKCFHCPYGNSSQIPQPASVNPSQSGKKLR
ncbi:MAG: hypothetical protein KA841_01610 [Chitinophagales bacterium]|nr:hypothetical protein [Chitinophagales bacterium]